MSVFSNNLAAAAGQSNGAPQAVIDYAAGEEDRSASKSAASGFKWSMNNKALAPMQNNINNAYGENAENVDAGQDGDSADKFGAY